MNITQFSSLIADFQSRIMNGRYVYIWYGEHESLQKIIPPKITSKLDIVETLRETDISKYANAEMDKLIKKQVSGALVQLSKLPKPRIVVLTNGQLLARYKTGIQIIYDNFIGDGKMIIFQVSKYMVDLPKLPSFVKYEPRICLNYLASFLNDDNIIEEEV